LTNEIHPRLDHGPGKFAIKDIIGPLIKIYKQCKLDNYPYVKFLNFDDYTMVIYKNTIFLLRNEQ
jgi:hypothetical protein